MIMDDDASPHNVFWWHQNNNTWAVRKGDWKLLKNPTDPANKAPIAVSDTLFLVNVTDHPDELDNMANAYPDKVMELTDEYYNWVKEIR